MKIRNHILPALQPQGGEEEIAAITEVIRSGWWGKGKKVQEFEEKFAKRGMKIFKLTARFKETK